MRSLDEELRKEYDQAAEAAPDLVKTGTPFVEFLRTEQHDPQRAAKRLVLYWKYRKQVFGDRWLYRMNMTGSGALSDHDIAIVRTGVAVLQSRPNQAPILLYDQSRMAHALGEAAVRISFYLFSTLSPDAMELAQTSGMTLLLVVTSAPRPPLETDPTPWQMILSGLPVRFRQALVAQSVEEGREHLIESLAYQQARIFEFRAGLPTERIVSDTTQGTLALLQEKGIPSQYVPTSLGGQYHYHLFEEWVMVRVALETNISEVGRQQPTRQSVLPALPVAFLASPARAVALSPVAASAAAPSAIMGEKAEEGESQDEDYRRRRNAMYVRRFYQRQNLAVESSQEQIRVLNQQNQRLREDNARLETLLEQARELVPAGEPFEEE